MSPTLTPGIEGSNKLQSVQCRNTKYHAYNAKRHIKMQKYKNNAYNAETQITMHIMQKISKVF